MDRRRRVAGTASRALAAALGALGALCALCAFGAIVASCILPGSPFAGYACDAEHACSADSACVQGRCVQRCSVDDDCAPGLVCFGGGCASRVPFDGGFFDAGNAAPDAGFPADAGNNSDAGFATDAGFGNDAGSPDAGFATDAGFGNDAGFFADAGPTLCFGAPPVCAPTDQVITVCTDVPDAGACAPGLTTPDLAGASAAVSAGAASFVFVTARTYAEDAAFHDDVTIVGESGVVVQGSTHALSIDTGSTAVAQALDLRVPVAGSDVVQVLDTSTLTLDRCVVGPSAARGIFSGVSADTVVLHTLVHDNAGGGAEILGAGTVENSVFITDGASASPFGAVRLAGAAAATVFRFNTLANNNAVGSTTPSGVICVNAVVVDSVISWGDLGLDMAAACVVQQSDVENLSGADPGAGNFSADPLFDVDGFHLTVGSPCADLGTTAQPPADDFDGDGRPRGAAPDVGADEVQ